MSMWLSSANKAAGAARGQAAAAAKREVATVQAQAAKQLIDFWSGKASPRAARKKTRR